MIHGISMISKFLHQIIVAFVVGFFDEGGGEGFYELCPVVELGVGQRVCSSRTHAMESNLPGADWDVLETLHHCLATSMHGIGGYCSSRVKSIELCSKIYKLSKTLEVKKGQIHQG